MEELLRTNDLVLISFVEALLREAGIDALVLDQNMSVIEGSLGVLPRRVLVPDGPDRRRPPASFRTPASATNSKSPRQSGEHGRGGRSRTADHRRRIPRRPRRGGSAGTRPSSRRPRSGPAAAPRSIRRFAGTLVDLGAGVGVAGMFAAARCPAARRRPGRARRDRAGLCPRRPVRAGQPSLRRARLGRRRRHRRSRSRARRRAASAARAPTRSSPTRRSTDVRPTHRAASGGPRGRACARHGGLDPWLRAAASVLKPGGELTVIFRADGLGALLAAIGTPFRRARHPAGPAARRPAGPPHPGPRRQGQPRRLAPPAAAGPSRRRRRRLSARGRTHPARRRQPCRGASGVGGRIQCEVKRGFLVQFPDPGAVSQRYPDGSGRPPVGHHRRRLAACVRG